MVALLPDYIRQEDSYKDMSGKGFIVRYLEIFGKELDDEYYAKIEGWLLNISPITSDTQYLDYFAVMLGDIERLIADDYDYRRFLTYLLSIYKVKGRALSYRSMLRAVGMETVVNDIEPVPVLYDTPGVDYDSGFSYDTNCEACSNYELIITGPTITGELYRVMKAMIALVEPINAKLTKITYNGDEITAVFIEVTIDDDGNLIYDNTNDPGLVLTLVNGDLIISGLNASLYYLDSNGDLYFIL